MRVVLHRPQNPGQPSKYPRWINIMKTSTGTFPKHSPGRVAPRFSSPLDTIRIIILLPCDQKCHSCIGSLSSRGCSVWPQDYVATMCVCFVLFSILSKIIQLWKQYGLQRSGGLKKVFRGNYDTLVSAAECWQQPASLLFFDASLSTCSCFTSAIKKCSVNQQDLFCDHMEKSP